MVRGSYYLLQFEAGTCCHGDKWLGVGRVPWRGVWGYLPPFQCMPGDNCSCEGKSCLQAKRNCHHHLGIKPDVCIFVFSCQSSGPALALLIRCILWQCPELRWSPQCREFRRLALPHIHHLLSAA